MLKHILRRLIAILIVFLIAILLFLLLWNKPSAALGAAIISIFLGSVIGLFLVIYFFAESISLFKKQKNNFAIANLIIGLILVIIILFILNNTLYIFF
jgi:hypothetical protein